MQFPAIHLNGSDALDLLAQYTNALEGVQTAITAVGKIECNGRDYYTISSIAASVAIQWKRQRMDQLTALGTELEATVAHIAEHPKTIRRQRQEEGRTGDVLGPLRAVPTETVYTAEQQANRAMLAALIRALPMIDGCRAGSADTIDAMRAAVAQAKAAGITVEG